MADCTATGTALDRVLQSAVSSALQNDNGASRHAMKALQSFAGSAAMTADATAGGVMPLEGPSMLSNTRMGAAAVGGDVAMDRMREMPMSAPAHASMMHVPTHHHMHPHHHHMMANPQQMMMMQQQMQYQMQMQQMQMSAMVEHQKAQQQQQQQQLLNTTTEALKQNSQHVNQQPDEEYEDDDVITVNEEDELHNEGITHPASIERLAQAWRDAEAEYAEFDDEYDVSDMGGLYSDHTQDAVHTSEPCQGFSRRASSNPTYEFSPQSQTYGCLTTPTTDIAPPSLQYPSNLYERGLAHFHSGEISSAILCFESTLRNIDNEHADAWRMLGKCHTEQDADRKAIACYLKSMECDPYDSETLLGLVVGYVNELDWERAVEMLRVWVSNHPLYAGMEEVGGEEDLYGGDGLDVEEENDGGFRKMNRSTMKEMRGVERLLLSALDYNKNDDSAADVYEALGVVYNVSRDYDAAIDSFQKAIRVRPDDYQLHNKLGATLANSNRSEEALPQYHAALKLKPKYTRGWLNMAISHSNLRNYSQAARCYLQTLSLNPEAKHVWSYLRIALTCDEKWDLLPLAASQNLSAFHEHFDFVDY